MTSLDPAASPPFASPSQREITRARWALMAQFMFFGMAMASWTSRMPSVRAALDVSELYLGSLLIIGGIGSLTSGLSAGAVVARFGTRRTLLTGTIISGVGFSTLGLGTALGSVPVFIVGAFINGLSGALINVPINVNAAAVERRVGRAILPHFHAGFSIGAGAGALLASGFALLKVHISVHILIVIAVVTLARLLLLVPSTSLDDAAPRLGRSENRTAVRGALSAWVEPRTLLLGVVLLAASLAEGTATTWLSLAVVDGFHAAEAAGAAAYATFVGCMTIFRFTGTRIIDRFGRVAVLRASGVSALAGILLFVFGPNLAIAWLGIALWGCGAALGNPIAIAAASDEPGKAGPRVSVVTSFSTVSSLAAPPLLGMLIQGVGARNAMLVVAAFVIVSLSVAGQARKQTGAAPDA